MGTREKTPEDNRYAAASPGTESVSLLDDDDVVSVGAPSLNPGTLVAGRYRIDSPLGRGGYAVVYRAHDQRDDCDVALKVLRADRLAPAALKRMTREAEAAGTFAHHHLVRVLDHGRDGEHAFLAMELIEGETLRARIARGPIPPDEAVRIASEILDALGTLHAQGIVHRDVKPSNILLGAQGSAKLADFGLVTRWSEDQTRATRSEAIVGTLEYVSPEQALGEKLDGRSDLYAVGVVLYEMLSGAPLHGARSSLGMLVAHLTKPAPDIRASREGVPEWLAAVVARLLAKSRDERYASAEEARTDLLARRVPRGQNPSARRQIGARGPGLIAAGILAVLAGAMGWRLLRPTAAPVSHIVAADVVAGAVRALDEGGRVVWSRRTGVPLDENAFKPSELRRHPRLVVTDLEGDGTNEVLLTATPEGGDLSDLLIFEGDGRERLRYHPQRRVTFGKVVFDTFNANTIHALVDRKGRHRLFVLWMHRPNFPSILEEISPTGQPLSAHYFAGHQQHVSRLMIGGREVLAVGGFHNETRGGSLTLLDLDHPGGRNPGENAEFVCQDCPQVDPLALIIFPRSDVLVAENGRNATAQVDGVISMEGGIVDAALQLGAKADAFGTTIEATIRYQVAPDLSRVLGMDVSNYVPVRHDILFRAHQLGHPFGARDLADLRKVIIWKDGGWKPLPFAPDAQ